MPFVAFLGCDGSGKSTVINGVSTRLTESGCRVTRGHWRPVALGHRNTGAGADNPHGLEPRGTFASLLKLCWLWLNWRLAWRRDLRAAAVNGMVLFDRYHADLIVDPQRYRYGGPMVMARMACSLMPQPDLVVFLDAEPALLWQRKQEVDPEALAASRAAYLGLAASDPRIRVVDASQPLDAVIDTVLRLITEAGAKPRPTGRC
jgi:thymidylate kinase